MSVVSGAMSASVGWTHDLFSVAAWRSIGIGSEAAVATSTQSTRLLYPPFFRTACHDLPVNHDNTEYRRRISCRQEAEGMFSCRMRLLTQLYTLLLFRPSDHDDACIHLSQSCIILLHVKGCMYHRFMIALVQVRLVYIWTKLP